MLFFILFHPILARLRIERPRYLLYALERMERLNKVNPEHFPAEHVIFLARQRNAWNSFEPMDHFLNKHYERFIGSMFGLRLLHFLPNTNRFLLHCPVIGFLSLRFLLYSTLSIQCVEVSVYYICTQLQTVVRFGIYFFMRELRSLQCTFILIT